MRSLRLVFLALAIAAGVLAYWALTLTGPGQETFVDLPSGIGSFAMGAELEQAGVIQSRYAFALMRLVKGGRLRAGEYRFDHPAPLAEVYGRLAHGDVYTRTVVIPEGFNLFDIASAVAGAGLGTREDFLAAARKHTDLIAAWSPHAASVEGYLFPDTYRFSRHATDEQMIAAMVKRFRQMAGQIGVLNGADIARTVTMASLVEKEVGVAEERNLVAGVFENRLRLGMKLQTDPTVVYASLLAGKWRGTIYRSDLESDSAYNTYRHVGLPPGPICNPGVAALKAAMAPVKTDSLYFVADAAGHSRFAATLAEHAANVASYRKAVAGR